MNEAQIEQIIGGQIYWIMGLLALFLIRNIIESAIQGAFVFFGKDLSTDDTIFLNGSPARVVRLGLYKSVFFVYEIKTDPFTGKAFISGGRKRVILNSALSTIEIDKPLQQIDLTIYDKPIKDPISRRNGTPVNVNHQEKRRKSDK